MTNVASINCCQAPHTTMMTHLKKEKQHFRGFSGNRDRSKDFYKKKKKNMHVNAGGENAGLLNGNLKHKTSAHPHNKLRPYCFL